MKDVKKIMEQRPWFKRDGALLMRYPHMSVRLQVKNFYVLFQGPNGNATNEI